MIDQNPAGIPATSGGHPRRSDAPQCSAPHSAAPLPAGWVSLRAAVETAGHSLTPSVFDRAVSLFNEMYAAGEHTPAELTREYEHKEFLVALDETGRPNQPTQAMLDTCSRMLRAHPAFGRWFQEGRMPEGEPVLMAARWLCHLVGLRHGTVEIFIDPPGGELKGFTLVQVRGMDKLEAPGAFDIPCAGHISGADSVEVSLGKELGEELNLTLDSLADLRLLGRYNSYNESTERGLVNNEYRVLYRATLKPDAVRRIRFTDGEVAGLSVFAVKELRALVQKFPERVASGLSDAIGYYE